MLALIDAYPAPAEAEKRNRYEPKEEDFIKYLAEQFAFGDLTEEVSDVPALLDAARRAGTMPGLDVDQTRRMLEHTVHCGRLAARFSPGRFDGDLLFVVATEDISDVPYSFEDWMPHVTGGIEVHEIACKHMEIAQPVHMAAVGRLLGCSKSSCGGGSRPSRRRAAGG